MLDRIDPPLSISEVEHLALEVFGVRASAERLSGERDHNFRLDRPDGAPLLLKISNSAEDARVTDMQTQALIHIARKAPDLPTPQVFPTSAGEAQHLWESPSGEPRVVRLLSFLSGVPLHEAAPSAELLQAIGAALAGFDMALADFRHPAEDYDLLWDVQHASRLTQLLWAIEDLEARRLAEAGLQAFARHAEPKLAGLRAQLIHNDLNPHNVLVAADGAPKVTGIIDLGDMVRAPMIDDLAVAAAYHIGFGERPLDGAAALARAYDAALPLTDDEFHVLTPLIIGRLAMSVTISSWRAKKDPDNRPYIFRNLPAALRGLELLLPLDADASAQTLRDACRSGR